MEIRLLGPVELVVNGETVPLGGPQPCAVLCCLALDANRPVPIERLIGELWPDSPPATARTLVQGYVVRLRKLLRPAGSARIVTRPGGYVLVIDPALVDEHRVRDLRDRAEDSSSQDAAGLLDRARAQWRGPALAGTTPGAELQQRTAGLTELWWDTTRRWASACVASGQGNAVLAELRELTLHDPPDAHLVVELVRALHAADRRGEAADLLHRASERLAPATPGTEAHRLRRAALGKPKPTRVDSQAPVPAQLPAATFGFTGRERELSMLDSWLDGDVDVGVLTGVPAAGTTALALAWAHRVLDRFPGGCLHAWLHGFDSWRSPADPAEVLRGFLRAFGVAESAIPREPSRRGAMLRSKLAGRRVLMLLDGARDAEQLRPLLVSAPGVFTVVTSRRALGPLPDVRARAHALPLLSNAQAHALARHVSGRHDFGAAASDPAARVVRCCGGLPLAVRLAATRLAAEPQRSVADLAVELEADPLGALDLADDGLSRAVAGSERDLTATQWAVFAALPRIAPTEDGIQPGDVAEAADLDVGTATTALRGLVAAGLLTEPSAGVFAVHPLLLRYARDRLGTGWSGGSVRDDSGAERADAGD